MHHPTQYQMEANIRQQEQLQQAAAHRAAKEAGRGPAMFFGWLFMPFRLAVAVVRLVPRPRWLAPGSSPTFSDATVSPDPGGSRNR